MQSNLCSYKLNEIASVVSARSKFAMTKSPYVPPRRLPAVRQVTSEGKIKKGDLNGFSHYE
jgi:hypothetical protein